MVLTEYDFQNEGKHKMRYISEMERDATWMSENTWAAKHGSANLNLWYEMQYHRRVNIEMEYVDDWSCKECGHTGISEAEDACPECDSTWAEQSDMEGDANNA